MKYLTLKNQPLFKNQAGQALSEYLILVVLIGVGSIIAAQSVGKAAITKLKLISNQFNTEVTLESTRGK